MIHLAYQIFPKSHVFFLRESRGLSLLEEKLENWVERFEENKYLNGSLFIRYHDKILLNQGFGFANWEHHVSNTATTKYRIGSLTKAFTALAIFQLHEKGKLNVNDNITKYIPAYPNGDRISIYNCLTHTSGIPNYTSFPDFWSTTMRLPSTLPQLIDSFKDLELHFNPGSRFEYSNSGYAILTAIIEHVSNMSYSDYILENICRPIGMVNTGCDDGIQVVPQLASGYSYWETPIHSAYADLSFPLGAYGLYSTTEDLHLWDKALSSSQLLPKELTDLMFTPHLSSYACGWVVSDISNRRCLHHFGDISGFSNEFLRFHEDNVTIIFLSNIDVTPVTQLSREIASLLFGNKIAVPPRPNAIPITNPSSFTGTYRFENQKTTLHITIERNELYFIVPKRYGVRNKFKLIPIEHQSTKTTFVTEMIHEQLTFYYSSSNKIEQVEYKDYNNNRYIIWKES